MRTGMTGILLFFLIAITPAQPVVSAKSAILLDENSGRILWSKNADVPRPPASTTKILTALLLIERKAPGEILTAPKGVEEVEESSLHLVPGEQVSVKEMLYALMLRSANDGCYTVATDLAGSLPAFAKLMNERAKQIGCTHSHFVTPHGLPCSDHLSTAHDLALIAREAMKYPLFREIVATKRHTIIRSKNQEDLLLVNRNKTLRKDSTTDGIKTGYTVAAGHCFVGSATRNGYRQIAVILNSEDWQKDYQTLVGWGFKEHERVRLAKAGEPVLQVAIANGKQSEVPVGVQKDLFSVKKKGALGFEQSTTWERNLQAPIQKGQKIGEIVFKSEGAFRVSAPLFALTAVEELPFYRQRWFSGGLLSSAGLGILWVRRKKRR